MVAVRARAGPGPGLPRPRALNPGPGPTALTQGPGTLGLASNPGPAWQAGPGFWARPRVPGPRFLRPGPWVWALGLGPLGLYCSSCLKYDIKVHTAFFKAAVNRKLLYELQKKYFMKKSLHWVKHTQIGDGGKVRVVKVVKL